LWLLRTGFRKIDNHERFTVLPENCAGARVLIFRRSVFLHERNRPLAPPAVPEAQPPGPDRATRTGFAAFSGTRRDRAMAMQLPADPARFAALRRRRADALPLQSRFGLCLLQSRAQIEW